MERTAGRERALIRTRSRPPGGAEAAEMVPAQDQHQPVRITNAATTRPHVGSSVSDPPPSAVRHPRGTKSFTRSATPPPPHSCPRAPFALCSRRTPMPLPDAIRDRIELFARNEEQYRDPSYKEAQLRQEYLDPFFRALGST